LGIPSYHGQLDLLGQSLGLVVLVFLLVLVLPFVKT
jgi:hypothetical protein